MSTIITDKIHTTQLIEEQNASIAILVTKLVTSKTELKELKTQRKELQALLQKEHAQEFDSQLSALDTKIYEVEQTIRTTKDVIKTCYTHIKDLSKHKIANDGFKRYCVECGEVITQ